MSIGCQAKFLNAHGPWDLLPHRGIGGGKARLWSLLTPKTSRKHDLIGGVFLLFQISWDLLHETIHPMGMLSAGYHDVYLGAFPVLYE